jgi:hypothetical protein
LGHQIAPSASRWWRFKYRFAGKGKRISLGVYPDVGLTKARDRRDEIHDLRWTKPALDADGQLPVISKDCVSVLSAHSLRAIEPLRLDESVNDDLRVRFKEIYFSAGNEALPGST